jgi:hypothetical protein
MQDKKKQQNPIFYAIIEGNTFSGGMNGKEVLFL